MEKIHDIDKTKAIIVFCRNVDYHKPWADKFPKVKGVYGEVTQVVEKVKALEQLES